MALGDRGEGAPSRLPNLGMSDVPDLSLTLPARPDNVAIVRHALSAFVAELGLGAARVGDILLAVTEACANAVVHGYEGREGPMIVSARQAGDELVVGVRDHGRGMMPRIDSPGLGLGLPVIMSLSDVVEIRPPADGAGGTEVTMRFHLAGAAR
jgi:serine/threonine-protein kinase RsbW